MMIRRLINLIRGRRSEPAFIDFDGGGHVWPEEDEGWKLGEEDLGEMRLG